MSDLTETSAAGRSAITDHSTHTPQKRRAQLGRSAQSRLRTGFGGRLCAVGAAVSMLLGMSASRADEPMPAPRCALRLTVAVTPDVPDPSNGGFLSSLLGDHDDYQLFLLSRADDTH